MGLEKKAPRTRESNIIFRGFAKCWKIDDVMRINGVQRPFGMNGVDMVGLRVQWVTNEGVDTAGDNCNRRYGWLKSGIL